MITPLFGYFSKCTVANTVIPTFDLIFERFLATILFLQLLCYVCGAYVEVIIC